MLDNNQWLGLGVIAGIAYLVDNDYRGGKEYSAESFDAEAQDNIEKMIHFLKTGDAKGLSIPWESDNQGQVVIYTGCTMKENGEVIEMTYCEQCGSPEWSDGGCTNEGNCELAMNAESFGADNWKCNGCDYEWDAWEEGTEDGSCPKCGGFSGTSLDAESFEAESGKGYKVVLRETADAPYLIRVDMGNEEMKKKGGIGPFGGSAMASMTQQNLKGIMLDEEQARYRSITFQDLAELNEKDRTLFLETYFDSITGRLDEARKILASEEGTEDGSCPKCGGFSGTSLDAESFEAESGKGYKVVLRETADAPYLIRVDMGNEEMKKKGGIGPFGGSAMASMTQQNLKGIMLDEEQARYRSITFQDLAELNEKDRTLFLETYFDSITGRLDEARKILASEEGTEDGSCPKCGGFSGTSLDAESFEAESGKGYKVVLRETADAPYLIRVDMGNEEMKKKGGIGPFGGSAMASMTQQNLKGIMLDEEQARYRSITFQDLAELNEKDRTLFLETYFDSITGRLDEARKILASEEKSGDGV